jgi:hypothetical protein
MLRKHFGNDMKMNRASNNTPHDASQECDAGRRRAREERQIFASPFGVAAAMPLLRCLLLCVSAAIVLLAPGKTRAADLDLTPRGEWAPSGR